MISATQLRVGTIIKWNDDLWRVMSVQHVTPGNWRGMVQTKLRNLRSGTQTEYRFRSEDKVERARLDSHEMEYLYSAAGEHHFMNTETFEQITLSDDVLGDSVLYLKPNSRIQIDLYEGQPVGIDLPATVDLAVTRTEPRLKRAAVTNILKPATLETGLEVQVPDFIEEGEVIRVDTAEGKYIERVSGK
jgi:elongation factor P